MCDTMVIAIMTETLAAEARSFLSRRMYLRRRHLLKLNKHSFIGQKKETPSFCQNILFRQ